MYKYVKRTLDIVFSILLIVTLLPLFLIITFQIYFSMGRPVLFTQLRTGLNNKPFRIYKYRTMHDKKDKHMTDLERITSTGRGLRLFRMDELPQLFNILRGDMSFIGPRPLLQQYLPYFNAKEIRRHNVRPGLTGFSQINDLNYPKWEDQFKNDLHYVNNISLKLDLYILFRTILKILRPASMTNTGISSGRLNFDVYRKLRSDNNLKINDF